MAKFTALIVEDTIDIQNSYKRAVERQGGIAIGVASLSDAVEAIKRRLFHIAIVDVRLSEDDETNVDGLKVLEFIKKNGDPTKAILITGYGSFQIAREAFKQFNVFEGLEKGISLQAIEATIARARQAFDQAASEVEIKYSSMLKGSLPLWEWEDKALRLISPPDGVNGLHRFLAGLLREFSPLLSHSDEVGCLMNASKKIAGGRYWSRGQGNAVLIAFGKKSEVVKFESGSQPAALGDLYPGDIPHLGSLSKKLTSNATHGIVRLLVDQEFAPFAQPASAK